MEKKGFLRNNEEIALTIGWKCYFDTISLF